MFGCFHVLGVSFPDTSYLSLNSEGAVVVEAPAPAAAPALGEPMDVMTALQLVLKKSKAHGGLSLGLHEAAKVIERHAAQLCVLAEDCDQSDYVKLVKALCADHNVSLITVPSAKTLGEWVGVSLTALICSDRFKMILFLLRMGLKFDSLA